MAALAFAAGMMLAAGLASAEGIVGSWKVELDYQGTMIPATIKFEEKDGKLAGTWTSERGTSELKDIKFEGGKLTFKRDVKFQDQEFTLDYAGKVEGNKLTGAFTTPMGEMAANGTKADGAGAAAGGAEKKPDLTGPVNLEGPWDFTAQLPDGTTSNSTFTVKKEGGDTSGLLETELGSATIKGIKVDGNKVHFKTEIDMGGVMVPLEFKGSTGGDLVRGTVFVNMEGQEMQLPIEGKRKAAGSAPASGGAPSGAAKLPGVWDVGATLPDGTTSQTTLTITDNGGKLTGKLETEIGSADIKEIKLDGNKYSYKAEIDMGGVMVPLEVTGTTGGDSIDGKAKMNMEGQEMEIPLKGSRKGSGGGAAAAPAAGGGALTGKVNLPGTWDVTATLPDGNTSQSTLTVSDNGGKLSGKLETEIGTGEIKEIHVDGNKIHMKAEIDMGGVMVPLDIMGTTGGDAIEAKAKMNMEGQEMELPLKGARKGATAASAGGAPAAAKVDDSPLTGAVDLPGNWETTATLPDGTSSQSTMNIKNEGGKFTGSIETEIGSAKINDLKLDGNKITIKTEIDMGGVMVPLQIVGTTGGGKLKGVAKLNMEGQEMELPFAGSKK